MKILVPVKQAALVEDDFELRDDGRDVDPDFVDLQLNEWDDYSLEAALQLKEANDGIEVVAVTVGDDDTEDALRTCLAKGADSAIRIWDDVIADADPLVIARVLAAVAQREAPDLVLAGTQSSDLGFSATGVAMAAFMGWPHAAVVVALDYAPGAATAIVERELEGGLRERLEVDCPAVLTIQLGINTPRYASLRGIKQARSIPIEELSPDELGLEDQDIGEQARGSRVREMYLPDKGQAEMIEGTPAEQAARIAAIVKEVMGG